MQFPKYDRVIYSTNPLVEVIFQVKFPRIFKIDEQIPVEFQKQMGRNYPFVETRDVVPLIIPSATENNITRRLVYDFETEQKDYKITIASEFLSVSTKKYVRWEDFLPHIVAGLAALKNVYSPPFFTRVGLRYVDVISRTRLGIHDCKWSELIRISALGLLADPDVPTEDVNELSAGTLLSLGDDRHVAIRSGLGQTEETGFEAVFIIDSDFYCELPLKDTNHVISLCSDFNKSAGRAFRWFLNEKLHQALGPKKPSHQS
ncbi:MAG: TIGR04255 family protein [Beijerinckiaceae bacterium]|nr:TIGR04255 family protein [Beijerinckiaceae bacterium]